MFGNAYRKLRINKRNNNLRLAVFSFLIIAFSYLSLSSILSITTLSSTPNKPPYLFLIPVKNTHTSRQSRLAKNICSLSYPPKESISVRFLTDELSFNIVSSSFSSFLDCGINDLSIVKDFTFVRGLSSTFSSSQPISPPLSTEENARHKINNQYLRRQKLSEARNYLVYQTLRPWHKSIVFLDSDLLSFDNNGLIIKNLEDTRGDIAVPHCLNSEGYHTYDLNSWRETPSSLKKVKEIDSDIPIFEGYTTNNFKRLHFDDIANLLVVGDTEKMKLNGIDQFLVANKPKEKYMLELDGIGGTLIFVKAGKYLN